MAGSRWVGYLVWAVLLGAAFVWEGIGLLRVGDGLPTLSDAIRGVMRSPVGRWALFAVWLWVGWHVFVRGWHFLLRGPVEEVPAGDGPGTAEGSRALFQRDVLPMLLGYLLMMGTLAAGWRARRNRTAGAGPHPHPHADGRADRAGGAGHGSPEGGPGRTSGRSALALRVAGTALGGYLLLLAASAAYYYGVSRVGDHFLSSAAVGGALLVGLALPVFAVLSWRAERRHARHPRGWRDALPSRAHGGEHAE